MYFNIDKIIYAYIFLCGELVIFNIFYIFFSNWQSKNLYKYSKSWKKSIKEQIQLLKEKGYVDEGHKNQLNKFLTRTNHLISYSKALETLRDEGEELDDYLKENYVVMQFLANQYGKKEVSDKTFFAFFISENPPCQGDEYKLIIEELLLYLYDSTIYCRENVLKALYAIGNCQGVENALDIINEKQWFHHNKLFSDGLMTFNGNKEELAERLWANLKNWDENIVISFIKFITLFSDKFKSRLFFLLNEENTGVEVRMAIIRYYRNHSYSPVKDTLIDYLINEDMVDENIKIVSASVLEKYPGPDTVLALKCALKSPNWYVRYNSASSLNNLKVDIGQLEDIIEGDDRYAKEIITYMMNLEGGLEHV